MSQYGIPMPATTPTHALSRRCFAICVAVGPLLAAAATRAQARELEHQVKAAYLYKFAGHVEWPAGTFASADTPLTFGVLGADDVATELERIKPGRMINEHPLAVRTLRPGDSLNGVQVLFVGQQDATALKRGLEPARQMPVLTVTETPGALGLGSMINFVLVESRVRFEISATRAERQGLKLSSKLLAVAQRVEQEKP